MPRLTKKKAVEQTREKWDWHYHHPSKVSSDDFPKCKEWAYFWNCPCCEYVSQYGSPEYPEDCKRLCPLKWPEGRCSRYGMEAPVLDGHYFWHWEQWKNSDYYRKKYAKLIRDLPERK